MKTKIIISTVCLAFLIYFSFISGCTEDSPVTPPVSEDDIVVGTLISSPSGTMVNSFDTVLFRFTVNPGTVFTEPVSHLIKITGNNETEIGLLQDNGELANGDDIANDNVYSGKFIFNESSAGDVSYKAKGIISATSNGYSSPLSFTVYSELSSQDISNLFKIQSDAKTQLMTYLGGNVGNTENAATQLVTWLQSQPGVAGVERNY